MIRIETQRIKDLIGEVRNYQVTSDTELWRLCEVVRDNLRQMQQEAETVLKRITMVETDIICEMEPIGDNHEPDEYQRLAEETKRELVTYIKTLYIEDKE